MQTSTPLHTRFMSLNNAVYRPKRCSGNVHFHCKICVRCCIVDVFFTFSYYYIIIYAMFITTLQGNAFMASKLHLFPLTNLSIFPNQICLFPSTHACEKGGPFYFG